ncbi:ABC transporter ATP-binding protein [Hippea sp. KM1]|uniref:ABC transporter ATP-binding protein n=1 Tax=Hippea sp. KM1 TaxID=944481 RepID=UPI00046CF30D|nr:ABC transporter ATP-binding protein [Hippea sp. KM1]
MIELSGVCKYYRKGSYFKRETVEVLRDVSITIERGKHTGIIGESGAGKSTLCRILSLLELPDKGRVSVDGVEVNRKNIKKIRGVVGMVFQDPITSLDSKMKIISSLKEANGNVEQIKETCLRVGLSPSILYRYPHQLSGGQQQRVAIARAILSKAKYILFDEFSSALDVSTQARIVNLLCDINKDREYSFVFVSHDVKLVGFLSDEIYVIYKGEIVEKLKSLSDALHPYTRLLIEGTVEDGVDLAGDSGCAFYSVCPSRMDRCRHDRPELVDIDGDRQVRCFLYD